MPEARCNKRWLALIFAALPAFAQPATVTGQVTETLHGKPLARATVKLRTQTPLADTYSAVTDAQGNFRISGIPAGLYALSFSRTGFVWPVSRNGDSEPPAPIGLRAGEQRTLNLQLTPAGILSGRILDADGDPLRNMRVQLVWWDGMDKRERVRKQGESDDRGEYRFYDIPPGSYYLKAAPPDATLGGYDYPNVHGARPQGMVPTYYPSARDTAAASELKLPAGEEVSRIDLRVIADKLYNVRVKVNFLPPPGSSIRFGLQPAAGGLSLYWADDISGFRLVPPGSYRLSGILTHWVPGERRSLDGYFRQNVEVTNSDLEIVAPAFLPTFSVTGTVRSDTPLPFALQGARVTVSHNSSDPASWSATDPDVAADGSFSLTDMTADSYTLSVQRPGVYVKSIKLGEREYPGAQVEIAAATNLTILLATDGGRLQGAVEAADGESSAGTSVIVYSRGAFVRLAVTDANGRFDMTDIPPGEYRLYAWNNTDFYTDSDFAARYESQSVAVSVAPGSRQAVSLRAIVPK